VRQELREWLEELACRAGLDGLPPFARKAALVAGVALLALTIWWWGRPTGQMTPVRSAREAPVLGATSAETDAARPSMPTSVTVHVVGASPCTGTTSCSPSAGGSVDLNTASATELDTLPGVGPATAAKIIADRTANGPFRTVEDLMRVPGIGPTRFESLKGLVVVR
jgi:comEA protein